MLLSEAFETYRRDYIVFKNQSHSTEESCLLAMRSLISFLGDIPIETLTFQMVRDWKEHLDKHVGINTVRLYIIKLRCVIGFVRLNGIKCINEATIGVPRRENQKIEYLSAGEVERLIEATSKPADGYRKHNRARNVAMISLLYASGIRLSELCRLNRQDLNDNHSFTVIGKGNKIRLCFYDERTQAAIDEYLALRHDTESALFLSDLTKKRVSDATVQEVFRNAAIKAGIGKNVHPHMMRHSFATNLLRNNTNLYYVSKFLGHQSTQTTEMYLHYVNEDLHKIYEEKHTI